MRQEWLLVPYKTGHFTGYRYYSLSPVRDGIFMGILPLSGFSQSEMGATVSMLEHMIGTKDLMIMTTQGPVVNRINSSPG